MFFHPYEYDQHEKRKEIGLAEGIIEFFNIFHEDPEESADIDTVTTDSFTLVLKKVETDIWIGLVMNHTNMYANNFDLE